MRFLSLIFGKTLVDVFLKQIDQIFNRELSGQLPQETSREEAFYFDNL